jgi:hypothetical protein
VLEARRAAPALPTPRDYEAFFRDRDARFSEVVGHEAAQLLQQARDDPGHEQLALIGGVHGVGVTVELVETLEEVFLAVKTSALEPEILIILFAAFFPEREFDEIGSVYAMPNRDLEADELGFCCLLD